MCNNCNKYNCSCKTSPCDGTGKAGDSSFSRTLILLYSNYKLLYLCSEEEIEVKSKKKMLALCYIEKTLPAKTAKLVFVCMEHEVAWVLVAELDYTSISLHE
jgi:hypothetical protein